MRCVGLFGGAHEENKCDVFRGLFIEFESVFRQRLIKSLPTGHVEHLLVEGLNTRFRLFKIQQ